MRIYLHILVFHTFVICFEYLCQGVSFADGMPVNNKEIDASVILEFFCSLEHRLSVIECVDDETEGQALIPWKLCLNNVDRNLSKKQLISLSCKSLYPGNKQIVNILTRCVDIYMSPEEAAAWMPVLKLCALTISEEAKSTRIYTEDSRETSSTNHKFYTT